MIFPVQGFFDLVGFGSCSDSQEYMTLRINTEECAVRYILALLSQFSNITKVYGSCLKELLVMILVRPATFARCQLLQNIGFKHQA